MANESAGWFSVVSARLSPETGESVNVGLVFGNGSISHFDYSQGLSRLRGLVDDYQFELIGQMVSSLSGNIRSFSTIGEVNRSFGPQLFASDPRELFVALDRKVREQLIRQYLPVFDDKRRKRPRSSHVQVRAIIDETLKRSIRGIRNYQISKAPTPAKLYPNTYRQFFNVPVPAIDRAMRFGTDDILIGGAQIKSDDPANSVARRGLVLSKAFWSYRQHADEIRQVTGRNTTIVGLIYNGASRKSAEVRDAKNHLEHIWTADAHHVIYADQAEGIEQLSEIISKSR